MNIIDFLKNHTVDRIDYQIMALDLSNGLTIWDTMIYIDSDDDQIFWENAAYFSRDEALNYGAGTAAMVNCIQPESDYRITRFVEGDDTP